MENKLTDNEIKKALECCRMPVGSGACNDCPFDYQRGKRLTASDKSCTTLMFDYALDLINRLEKKNEAYKYYYEECLKDLKNANAENERFQKAIQVQELMLKNQDYTIL